MVVLIMSSTGMAEIKAKAFSFSPFVGGYVFESQENLNNRPISGLRLGYDITKNWALEGVFEFLKSEYGTPALTSKTNMFGYRLEALYNFMPERRWVPYLAVGAGGRSLGYDHELVTNRNQAAFDYGVGLKYFLYSNLALRADVRHIIPINDRYNNFEYTLGATMYFGGTKQAVAAPVAVDSDNDGVVDDYDKCPGTPIGVKVDQNGCPLDSDKDGVYDSLDKCPGTPASVKVDEAGCPLDSENDGVYDSLDKCPGTPVGVEVDQVGCPLDSDKDGVYDYLDKCPGTPTGVKVDKVGCPLDSDKDGVPDYLDSCPGTPAGAKVDQYGCPPMEEMQEVRAQAPAAAAQVETKVVTKEAAAAAATAKEMFEKGRATINVEFATNKADIKPVFDKELQRFGDVMKNYPDLSVVIEGHTDNVGGKAMNEQLSAKRANSVKSYLVKKFGIAESRLTAKGYGMSKPIAGNKTKEGRQKNRRVEAAVDYKINKK